MAVWTFCDYIELTGRNPIQEWLADLPDADSAKVDYRIQQMSGMIRWGEKWVSKYEGRDELYELRITGKGVQYRPLGTYFGQRRFLLLCGAIEKNWKIPKSDLDTAERRLTAARRDSQHVTPHQFGGEDDLE